MCLNRLIFLFFLLLFRVNGFSQFSLKSENYNAFDGRIIPCYMVESRYTVLFIDTSIITKEQRADTNTLLRLVKRVDTLYAFYKNNLGFEPVGGNPKYSNKANVFFGPPSCGSGCGLVGAKGIEVDGFRGIYYNLKYRQNVNRDVIIGYEFGRNFFNFSDKILFPFRPNTEDKNGGFAEAFAALMYQYAFDEIMDDPEERTMNETLMNLKWARTWSRGYMNDTSANPYNCFAKWELDGVLDPNRGKAGHDNSAYFSTTALFPIFDIFGKEKMFPGFFNNIRQQPSVITIEDALSNIAYAASKTIQTNLNAFFINVLKFRLNQTTIDQIAQFPSAPSKLITDENLLYFFSPFDTIPLNLRSTNYLADNCKYLVMNGTDTVSFSDNGNNYLPYSILKKRRSIQLQCYLVNSSNIKIDSFSTEICKRDKIKLIDKASDMFAYYLSNETSKVYFKDSVLVIEGIEKNKNVINRGLVYWMTAFRRGRVIKLEGDIRHVSPPFDSSFAIIDGINKTGWTNLYQGGPVRSNGTERVGVDVAVNDTVNYYHTYIIDSSSLYLPPPSSRMFSLKNVSFQSSGYSSMGYFKNVVLSDVTDTDLDGILDFDDDCPTIAIHPTLPKVSDTLVCLNTKEFSLNASPSLNHKLLWYSSNVREAVSDSIPPKIKPNALGQFTFYVSQINNQNGCEGQRAKIIVNVGGVPQNPIVDSLQLCKDVISNPLTAPITSGNRLLWYGTSETGGSPSITAPTPSTSVVGTAQYFVSQQNIATGCESGRSVINVSVNPIPLAPKISRDSQGFLTIDGLKGIWFKDGKQTGDTLVKIKPSENGYYTVSAMQNGCISLQSETFYYLVTSLSNLDTQTNVIVRPNPFTLEITVEFSFPLVPYCYVSIIDINGRSFIANKKIYSGNSISVASLIPGNYILQLKTQTGDILRTRIITRK